MDAREKKTLIENAIAQVKKIEDMSGYQVWSFWTSKEVRDLEEYLYTYLGTEPYNFPKDILVIQPGNIACRKGQTIQQNKAFTLSIDFLSKLLLLKVNRDYLDA